MLRMSTKKKIYFYINVLCKGGAERVILQLANHFYRAGYEAVVVTSYKGKDEYEIPTGIRRVVLEDGDIKQSQIKRNINRIRKLRKICITEKADVLISFMQEPNFRAVLATLGLKTKTIVSVRNDPKKEYSGIAGRFISRIILPMAEGCVFQTQEAKLWFPEKLQKKSAIILNAVAESFFEAHRRETANTVAIGRLTAQKNHDLLIRAFAGVASKYPTEKLLIYGDGERKEHLTKLIETMGLKERVCLMGTTSQVEQVLTQASIFVLSSDYEGLPNALMEAMAVGVPIISTDCPCGGPKALIEDGENGLLVPVGDEEEMAKALNELLSNPEYAKKMGRAVKESAERFKPDRVFLQWEAIVNKVMNGE